MNDIEKEMWLEKRERRRVFVGLGVDDVEREENNRETN